MNPEQPPLYEPEFCLWPKERMIAATRGRKEGKTRQSNVLKECRFSDPTGHDRALGAGWYLG